MWHAGRQCCTALYLRISGEGEANKSGERPARERCWASAVHLVPEEKHERARVIQLVHGVEVGYLVDVHLRMTASACKTWPHEYRSRRIERSNPSD